ncbi:hypothetical protein AB0F11_35815 [Streptomyces sp. NPDC032472]|uniref:hypothetical protein n=1 Tax=Streptomyces sp. NPDC032472 TaxID=3155018 RepID=UPI0033E0B533
MDAEPAATRLPETGASEGEQNAMTHRETVRNDIRGGVQHGPVIQSGHITSLTIHVDHPPTVSDEQDPQ